MSDASETYDTDAIVDVYQHLLENGDRWSQHLAAHGLEFEHVRRAINVLFIEGDGNQQTALSALSLGLQLGAMRLDPIDCDPEAQKPCSCPVCTLNRLLRGEEAEGGS